MLQSSRLKFPIKPPGAPLKCVTVLSVVAAIEIQVTPLSWHLKTKQIEKNISHVSHKHY